jgi:DNA uptake protein ComE-like DNA-binding protein
MQINGPLPAAGKIRRAALAFAVALGATTMPAAGSTGATAADQPPPMKRKYSVVPSEQQIDINSAGREQLMTLPGIGDAEARRIIAGRPYVSKGDLVAKKVLPEGLYISIRYRIKSVPIDKTQSQK